MLIINYVMIYDVYMNSDMIFGDDSRFTISIMRNIRRSWDVVCTGLHST